MKTLQLLKKIDFFEISGWEKKKVLLYRDYSALVSLMYHP